RHEVVTEGLGELRGLDTLMAARTSDGATVMAYMPTSRATTVDLSKLSGRRHKVWWFNPRTGTSEAAGEVAAEPRKQFVRRQMGTGCRSSMMRPRAFALPVASSKRGFAPQPVVSGDSGV
ncbi:MAG: hypothetical protein DMG09_00185, partial [Acidobacteria bacterium]